MLPGHRVVLGRGRPLRLDSGAELSAFPLAYQGYGTLNPDKSNVILVCHALTGDQFVAEQHPVTGKPGWWSAMVGPGRTIDTNRYYVLCINVLGGCMGSAGPSEINPATGEPMGLAFPIVTIADMVRAQAMLLDHLGIDKLFAVIGGSMGGMQALEWASLYPEPGLRRRADRHCRAPLGAEHRLPRGRAAGGDGRSGLVRGRLPGNQGKSRSRAWRWRAWRRTSPICPRRSCTEKFGRKLQDRENIKYGFDAEFQVESYLRYQGRCFVERFDANSYLFITRAMDYFDMAAGTAACWPTPSATRRCASA